jgi:hypothetical protein
MPLPDHDHSPFERKYDLLGAPMTAGAFLGSAVIVAVLIMTPAPALAAAEVRGQPANMQLHAQNASIREVLDALSSEFKLTYQLPPNIGRKVSGLYSGTLRQVLTRVLDGNDYIVEVSDGSIKVVVLGASGKSAVASAGPVVVPAGPVIAPAGPAPATSDNAATPQTPASKPIPPLTSFR